MVRSLLISPNRSCDLLKALLARAIAIALLNSCPAKQSDRSNRRSIPVRYLGMKDAICASLFSRELSLYLGIPCNNAICWKLYSRELLNFESLYQIRLNNPLFNFSLLFLLPSALCPGALSPPKKGVVNLDLVLVVSQSFFSQECICPKRVFFLQRWDWLLAIIYG